MTVLRWEPLIKVIVFIALNFETSYFYKTIFYMSMSSKFSRVCTTDAPARTRLNEAMNLFDSDLLSMRLPRFSYDSKMFTVENPSAANITYVIT